MVKNIWNDYTIKFQSHHCQNSDLKWHEESQWLDLEQLGTKIT